MPLDLKKWHRVLIAAKQCDGSLFMPSGGDLCDLVHEEIFDLFDLAQRAKIYETALREIATATGYPPNFPREGWGYLQSLAREALKP